MLNRYRWLWQFFPTNGLIQRCDGGGMGAQCEEEDVFQDQDWQDLEQAIEAGLVQARLKGG